MPPFPRLAREHSRAEGLAEPMTDPLVVAASVGVVGAMAGGPSIAYAVGRLPAASRRAAEWALIIGAGAIAAAMGLWPEAFGGIGFVCLLATLPGLVAYLAWRTLFAPALVSLAPFYFVIGELTRGRTAHMPAMALDQAIPVVPAWMLVYGSLYVAGFILPLLVVRDPPLVRRTLQALLGVMLVSYLGFLVYPTSGPRPDVVPGEGFAA